MHILNFLTKFAGLTTLLLLEIDSDIILDEQS
jgi:hypothetical protein